MNDSESCWEPSHKKLENYRDRTINLVPIEVIKGTEPMVRFLWAEAKKIEVIEQIVWFLLFSKLYDRWSANCGNSRDHIYE